MSNSETADALRIALRDDPEALAELAGKPPPPVDKPISKPSKLITLDQVNPMPPQYQWDPYIRAKNINVIRADGGAGKTMLTMAYAAAITTGIQPPNMPGVLLSGQGSVLYYGAEDDIEEYRHRADLCGCDPRFLHLVADTGNMPTLTDMPRIRADIIQSKAKLVVFDPIQQFLGADADMNKANQIRPLLEGLRSLCREQNCSVIIIEHLNKATQQKAHYRGIGTVDIINAARSALMVGWHPEEYNIRCAAHIKANAKYGQAIAFTIDDSGRFSWQKTRDVGENDIMGVHVKQGKEEPVDPVLSLVLALMEAHPNGWTGTAEEMLCEGITLTDCSMIRKPSSIGMKLPGINHLLAARGIKWQKGPRRTHGFQRCTTSTTNTTNTGIYEQLAVQLPVQDTSGSDCHTTNCTTSDTNLPVLAVLPVQVVQDDIPDWRRDPPDEKPTGFTLDYSKAGR